MNYLLIENGVLVGVSDYEPNIGNDDIQVITYSGNIPSERIIYIDGKIADSENYIFINNKYVKKQRQLLIL